MLQDGEVERIKCILVPNKVDQKPHTLAKIRVASRTFAQISTT